MTETQTAEIAVIPQAIAQNNTQDFVSVWNEFKPHVRPLFEKYQGTGPDWWRSRFYEWVNPNVGDSQQDFEREFSVLRCNYCSKPIPRKKRDPHLLDGFRDNETGHNVCTRCETKHYTAKTRKSKGGGIIVQEMPLMAPEVQPYDGKPAAVQPKTTTPPAVQQEITTPAAPVPSLGELLRIEKKLQVTIVKHQSNTLGIKVRIIVDSLLTNDSVTSFAGNFLTELKTLKTGNHLTARLQYKVKLKNEYLPNEVCEIWHTGSGLKDAVLIMKVTRINGTVQQKITTRSTQVQTAALPVTEVKNSYTRSGYPGNKYAADVYKRIINQFPPHTVFISGFLGNCAVMKEKKPAPGLNFGFEVNQGVINTYWKNADIAVFNHDFIDAIYKKNYTYPGLTLPTSLIYLDPPYLLTERRNHKQLYDNELTDQQHILEWCVKQKCMIAISHYPCKLYDKILKGWRKMEYKIQTHGGTMVEALYMNYPEPEQLHEYTYLGDNRTERQNIKRKIDALVKKLKALPPQERNAIIEAVNQKTK
jgi:DNA adenine methylase